MHVNISYRIVLLSDFNTPVVRILQLQLIIMHTSKSVKLKVDK